MLGEEDEGQCPLGQGQAVSPQQGTVLTAASSQNPWGHPLVLSELCLGLSSPSGAAIGIVEISLFNRLRFLCSSIRLL